MLDATPAALVASATSLKSLQTHYKLENATGQGGLEWVRATPKAQDGQIKNVMIGFQGKDLRSLVILDNFGQRSDIQFQNFGSKLPANVSFNFKPPAGADVLKQ